MQQFEIQKIAHELSHRLQKRVDVVALAQEHRVSAGAGKTSEPRVSQHQNKMPFLIGHKIGAIQTIGVRKPQR